MKKLFTIPILSLIIVGCTKKTESITPEKSTKVIEVDSNTSMNENNILERITENNAGKNIIFVTFLAEIRKLQKCKNAKYGKMISILVLESVE